MSSVLQIPFALNSANKLVSIDEPGLLNGRACGCTCPGCGEPLMAKMKGQRITRHFAHLPGSACKSGYESALHLAVKEILAREKRILLPGCHVSVGSAEGACHYHPHHMEPVAAAKYPRSGFSNFPGRMIEFDEVILERSEGDIRPDIIGIIGGRRLYIEVAVTSFVDEHKMAKLRERCVAALEIDLSDVYKAELGWTWDQLQQLLINESSHTNWLLNPRAEKAARADQEIRAARSAQRKKKDEDDAARKQAWYENNFKPSMSVDIWLDRRTYTSVAVKLCPRHVSARIDLFAAEFHDVFKKLSRAFGGRLNANRSQWEFEATEEMFFNVVKMFLAEKHASIRTFSVPDMRTQDFVDQVGAENLPH